MKAIRLVDSFKTKDDAEDAMMAYAQLLTERGDTERFGVFTERIRTTGVWGVYLLDRQYAPTRTVARNRGAGDGSRQS